MEAAAIYRQGWAPEIWLTQAPRDERTAALLPPGVALGTADHLNRVALGRLDVPGPAIRVLTSDVRDTVDELRAAAAFRGGGAASIIGTK